MKEDYKMLCGISISELDTLPPETIVKRLKEFRAKRGNIDEIDETGRSIAMLVKHPMIVRALWELKANFRRVDYHNDSVLRHLEINSQDAYNEALRLLANEKVRA